MTDFDRNEKPSLEDIKHDWRVKLAAAVALIIAIAVAVIDIMGLVDKWG